MDHDGIKLCPTENIQAQYKRTQVLQATAPVGMLPAESNDNRNAFQQQQMNLLGPENTITTCQFCRASIKTAVKYTTTSRTHMAAALWGMICCLCCVPYGAESAKNTDHYCPACQRYLGTYVK
ncbi:lipopolysaccharide-induced tumor necrosis factor-alpha factor homolog isoform X2 [Anticarsia gemmatalis]